MLDAQDALHPAKLRTVRLDTVLQPTSQLVSKPVVAHDVVRVRLLFLLFQDAVLSRVLRLLDLSPVLRLLDLSLVLLLFNVLQELDPLFNVLQELDQLFNVLMDVHLHPFNKKIEKK